MLYLQFIYFLSFLDTAGQEIPNLPTYTASDVAMHDTLEKKIWVCYKSGVYDITKFVSKHPGGDKILMAAGGSLEPFWELFAVHKNPQVRKVLIKILKTKNSNNHITKILKSCATIPYKQEPSCERCEHTEADSTAGV